MAFIRSCLYALSAVPALTIATQSQDLQKRDSIIAASLRDTVSALQLGATNALTTVPVGIVDWLSGAGPHAIYGNINNYGTILISQTDALTTPSGDGVQWQGTSTDGSLRNFAGSSFILNDASASTPSTYNLILSSLENNGTMQLCGPVGSAINLWCNSADCYNGGLIVFEQVRGSANTASMYFRNEVQAAAPAAQNIINNGGVLMRSARVDFTQNILGTGCYMMSNSAVMFLQSGVGTNQNTAGTPALNGQSIYFVDGTAAMHIEQGVYSGISSTFGPRLYNFGAGNAIEFAQTITAVTYSAVTGLVTVNLGVSNTLNILVGAGYVPTGFIIGSHDGLSFDDSCLCDTPSGSV
ncbi:hypothetical protein AMS68_004375 [Peltaster fructicola]|uniref:Hyphally-regulated cell wall protein N-terminal domain-containing protein n=1 Tax=Peltaster fructicola TaxID=286661 RepID=A0A6H0XW81_9PEZI|nr:hypothetical protein AMS68_004375 [Peltaster fructicola]